MLPKVVGALLVCLGNSRAFGFSGERGSLLNGDVKLGALDFPSLCPAGCGATSELAGLPKSPAAGCVEASALKNENAPTLAESPLVKVPFVTGCEFVGGALFAASEFTGLNCPKRLEDVVGGTLGSGDPAAANENAGLLGPGVWDKGAAAVAPNREPVDLEACGAVKLPRVKAGALLSGVCRGFSVLKRGFAGVCFGSG